MSLLPSPFYPIIDTGVCATHGLDPAVIAEACIRGGALLIQLRQKEGSGAAFLRLAERAVAAGRGAAVIVNDRPDIARLSGAAGVHVGQDDLDVAAVRTVVGNETLVGISTHNEAQIDAALQTSASYVAVGPVFGTATKNTGYQERGLDLVRYAAGRGKPVVAIGGITLDRVQAVLGAGASAAAVISDLLIGGNPEARVRQFLAATLR